MAGVSTAFVTWNNPKEIITYKHNEDGSPVLDDAGNKVVLDSTPTIYAAMSDQEICDTVLRLWVNSKEGRKGAVTACLSADGLHHLHMVLQVGNTDSERFTYQQVQKLYGVKFHLEPVRGSKKEALDYIYKRGKWEEKGEIILAKAEYGEIAEIKGKRSDLGELERLLSEWMSPKQIYKSNIAYRRFDKMIKAAYIDRKVEDAGRSRDVVVYWHVGASETGKSHYLDKYILSNNDYSMDDVYVVSEYERGFMDYYMCQKILWLDDLKPDSMKYSVLLSYLDRYVVPVHARYNNVYALWNEVHITSVFPPEVIYEMLVPIELRKYDSFDQLKRRIKWVYYHYLDQDNQEKFFVMDMKEYKDYKQLLRKFDLSSGISPGGVPAPSDQQEIKFIQEKIFKSDRT